MKKPTPEDLDKAWAFRESVVDRADIRIPFPAWHGWVIVDAFLAGMEAARQEMTEKEQPK